MPAQDTTHLKERIITIIKTIGPSIPSYVSNQINMSILFTSAFLSELLSEKRLKISHMRIGSSPIYFIPGQENELEKYSNHLKSREKDAFVLLKEKKFLKDSEQEPAIRVALRSIRDFAIPLSINGENYWKYLTVNENEFNSKNQIIPKDISKEHKQEEKPKEIDLEIKNENITPEKILKEAEKIKEKLEEANEEKQIEREHLKKEENKEIKHEKQSKSRKYIEKDKKITKKKKTIQKTNDNFFNKVKEKLIKKNIEILDIDNFNKNDLILKIKEKEEKKLLFAYNKKKISDLDIIKANKKASELKLRYSILSFGELPKKTIGFIEAIKNLSDINKIEEN